MFDQILTMYSMKPGKIKTDDFRKSPTNSKVSPTRKAASPKNAAEKISPTNKRKVASPKALTKAKTSPKANAG